MNAEKTVQLIPQKLFKSLSGHWFGDPYLGRSGDFQETILVQPVKFNSAQLAFGLHVTREVTEFVMFNTIHPFDEATKSKNTIVYRLAGGEVLGIYGSKQVYSNRLVQPAHQKMVYRTGSIYAFGVVLQQLHMISNSYHIPTLEKRIPVSDILKLQPIVDISYIDQLV